MAVHYEAGTLANVFGTVCLLLSKLLTAAFGHLFQKLTQFSSERYAGQSK